MARDLIAILLDVPADSFEINLDLVMPSAAAEHLQRAQQLRETAHRAQADASLELRAAARVLRESGMPLRDVGRMLGVSYQRAHQLVA